MVFLSADDRVCIFVLFVVCMWRPSQGGWMVPGPVFKWFPFCEFSLFDTP